MGRNVLSYFVHVRKGSQITSRVNWFRRPFGFRRLEKGQNGGSCNFYSESQLFFPSKCKNLCLEAVWEGSGRFPGGFPEKTLGKLGPGGSGRPFWRPFELKRPPKPKKPVLEAKKWVSEAKKRENFHTPFHFFSLRDWNPCFI